MDLVSPHPYWPWKNGLLGVYPPLRKNVSADVAVLGTGISGALIAERLSREGLNILILDKREAGLGSTSANTALLQYELDTSLIELAKRYGREDAEHAYRLCHGAIDRLENLIQQRNIACDFHRKASVYLASQKSDVERLRTESSARIAMGIPVEYWDEMAVTERFSFPRPAAIFSSQAAELDPHKLTHALLGLAAMHGARIYDRTEIVDYEPGSKGVRLATNTGCIANVRQVVFATGYESKSFLPRGLVNLKSTYALASEPLESFDGWWERCLLWETARPYLYLRTTADGRAFAGGEDDPFRHPWRRDRLVEKKTARLEASFRRMFPHLALEVAARWAGTFGETKDSLAYIGSIRQMPRCFFALGYGGNGIVYSVIAAEIIRDLLLERPNADARIFRFDR